MTSRAAAMGRFITVEGGEGAGKSTQVARLVENLARLGVPVISTREPGGAPGAEMLRELLLHRDQAWTPLAETLLHFAARAEHVERTIRPALAAGRWVICDRFTDSTRAYQAYGQGASLRDINTLQDILNLEPELTVVLQASPAIARARMARRGGADRYERLGPDFFARVEDGFRQIVAAAPERCIAISADGSVDEVAEAVLQAVTARFRL